MSSQVAIVVGSDSDIPELEGCFEWLRQLAIGFEVRVISAHRTPDAAHRFAREAEGRGIRVLIAAAGGAAHLAGARAANSMLPVIGIPIAATPMDGLDALLSTVQMPPGIPVATVAIGKMGARTAALLAAQILAVADPALQTRLRAHREEMAAQVVAKDAAAQQKSSFPG